MKDAIMVHSNSIFPNGRIRIKQLDDNWRHSINALIHIIGKQSTPNRCETQNKETEFFKKIVAG